MIKKTVNKDSSFNKDQSLEEFSKNLLCGIDVGSTTIKAVVMDGTNFNIVWKKYTRHFSNIKETFFSLVKEIAYLFNDNNLNISITGSGGIGLANALEIPFIQEVVASSTAIKKFLPQVDVVIELGGEDAKLSFFTSSGIDQRMNETCAGGTGAFIDQMSTVLQTTPSGLNDLAALATDIYPIAARCGVFAKADIMPMLNEGVSKENIAISIFQAVVNQTIGGLACGYPIKGNVAFLGGPLSFLPELRKRFIETLELKEDQVFFPEDAKYFVAIGAALNPNSKVLTGEELKSIISSFSSINLASTDLLRPLFLDEGEYSDFLKRHNVKTDTQDIKEFLLSDIPEEDKLLFIGIDAGSTTTKFVVINKFKQILWTFYGSNKGSPLLSSIEVLKNFYKQLEGIPFKIGYTGVTGYGEFLLKSAIGIDIGEVETISHYKAASFYKKDVSFILDIGGQDIKCIYIKNGIIQKIVLNEACSSGCGSFIENFAKSLSMDVKEFARIAVTIGEPPVDLGSRCTVFMNSKVKQAHKEGASIASIAAGLSYSVIRNAFYKVIKLQDPKELGDCILVQGGTFFNDSVLRAMENICDRPVFRPDIAGLMGAFGIGLIALEKWENSKKNTKDLVVSNLISSKDLDLLTFKTHNYRCSGCSNKCMITSNKFSNGKRFISGNRCEKLVKNTEDKIIKTGNNLVNIDDIPNLYDWKYQRLFSEKYYNPVPEKDSVGTLGIPRVLNMYENYPFWFSLFTELGYRVVLSSESSDSLYNEGLSTIPSQTVCYPAKMVHGHILDLINNKKVENIFYPCIQKENNEVGTHNQYNCPVVCGYPDVIRLNMDVIKENNVNIITDFLPLDNPKRLYSRILELKDKYKIFSKIDKNKLKKAISTACEKRLEFKKDLMIQTKSAISYMKEKALFGIVLAGRPYHLDPAINHGISDLLHSNGVVVFTEDGISSILDSINDREGVFNKESLSVTNQWVYHSRLYKTARYISKIEGMELVQLNSFGCGLDAITTTQVEDILEKEGKIYTCLKIDEGSNLSSIRIRIRSLLYAMNERKEGHYSNSSCIKDIDQSEESKKLSIKKDRKFFKKKGIKILIPQLSPIHFDLMQAAFESVGFNSEILPSVRKEDIRDGLNYIHNDACYPAVVVVSQIIAAIKSGRYDLKNIAIAMFQTSGPCRATNYVSFIKKALSKENLDIPIFVVSYKNMNSVLGKSRAKKILSRILLGSIVGDLLLKITNRLRPFEVIKGSTEKVRLTLLPSIRESIKDGSFSSFKKIVIDIIKAFDEVKIYDDEIKPRVGIVGEILIKYHTDANEDLVGFLESQGAEVIVPDITDFSNYCFMDDIVRYRFLSGSWWEKVKSVLALKWIEKYRSFIRKNISKAKHKYDPIATIWELSKKAEKILSLCHQSGEGWLLTAEMIELIENDCSNIICVQPFGCLPNHISGKGVIKELKRRYNANIAPIDYDPGTSTVNQINRIKLMMSVAVDNLEKKLFISKNKKDEEDRLKDLDSNDRKDIIDIDIDTSVENNSSSYETSNKDIL